jgi:hypothetical protein
MNARPVIWISVALNVALAAALFLVPRPAPPAPPVPGAPQTDIEPVAALPTEAPPEAVRASPSADFHWSQVASDDLKVYRDNLLAVGCPRPTVRDIILGEINEHFIHQRRALMASIQGRYWEFLIRGEAALRTEWAKPLEALSAERGAMIHDVLGEDYAPAEADLQESRGDAQERLAWLPEEKRERLLALEQKREQALEAWARSVGERAGGEPTTEDNARLEALEKEFADARKELLTPEELEESRLRASKESLWAAGLSGFEPTEEQWRKVTKVRADFDEAMQSLSDPGLSDVARRERMETLQAELEHGMREALGDHYDQYELANNEQFQAVQRITQRYGLSNSVAAQAYEVQQAAMAEAERLRADPDLSARERQGLLTGLQQETERALARTLGEQVLVTYKEYGGDWLRELNQ